MASDGPLMRISDVAAIHSIEQPLGQVKLLTCNLPMPDDAAVLLNEEERPSIPRVRIGGKSAR